MPSRSPVQRSTSAATSSTIGGKARNCIAVIDATTGAATSWNPHATGGTPPNPQVWALNLSGSKVYAGGYFTGIGGQPRNFIAAVNTTGGGATSWNPDAESVPFGEPPVVYALRVDGSIVYAGGAFDAIGGQPRSHLAALNAAGGAATSWDPQPDDTVQALALGPDGWSGLGGSSGAFRRRSNWVSPGSSHKPRGPEAPERRSGHAAYPNHPVDQLRALDSFRVTAARTRAFNAFSSISSPSWKSIARLVFPSRLELKRPEGSSSDAPLAKVIFTTFL